MFLTTLNQMAVLALFIAVGFIVKKLKLVPDNSAQTLSKLENTVFIPALVLSTFMNQFTVKTLSTAWKLLLFSLGAEIIIILVTVFVVKLASKEDFIRKICTYGLSFSNFGFMGNAVVEVLFPNHFMNYLIFVIPLWTLIYSWGVPVLLLDKNDVNVDETVKHAKLKATLKRFLNPMFVALLIGAIIGVTGLGEILPKFMTSVAGTLGNCMSPIAMIISGMIFATVDFKKVLSSFAVYYATVLRLIVYPLVFGGIALLISKFIIPIPEYIYVCFICSLAMPLGLNTIVIPAAYGKDTSVPAGMALVSHLLSLVTIPLILMLFL